MPTYVFRCAGECADIEQSHPMTDIPEAVICPDCGATARRTIAAPRLGAGRSVAMRLADATRATAERPAVVTSVPGSPGTPTPVSRNPLHQRLPRP
ncbi:FmdB family zinc ribbon protein [Gordonia sp. DT30]|uniref:FmdB family zinc ribbon protein n=1 Tax=unclassified Gordonia (in: high G+C Gram-positive bacteria) TaxID=2657482 RepID=UPI003CFA55BF